MYNTTLITQRNKRNVSNITSGVGASQRRNCCSRNPQKKRSKEVRRRILKFSGDHHRTAAVVATATTTLQMKQTPHGRQTTVRLTSSKSRPTPQESRNVFAAQIDNIPLSWTNVFATFIRPSHEKMTCAHTDNYDSTRQHGQTSSVLPSRRKVTFWRHQWSVTVRHTRPTPRSDVDDDEVELVDRSCDIMTSFVTYGEKLITSKTQLSNTISSAYSMPWFTNQNKSFVTHTYHTSLHKITIQTFLITGRLV